MRVSDRIEAAIQASPVPVFLLSIPGAILLVSAERQGDDIRHFTSVANSDELRISPDHEIGRHNEAAVNHWLAEDKLKSLKPIGRRGYMASLGSRSEDPCPLIRSNHPEPAVRRAADSALAWLTTTAAPYTFNVFSANEVGIDGELNLEAMIVAALKGLRP